VVDPYIPYAWQEKGETIKVESSRGKRLSVLGFLSVQRDLVAYTTEGIVDSDVVIACFDAFSSELIRKTVVSMDNSTFHTSEAIRGKIPEWQSKNLEIFYLPRYSPRLNLIEIFWRFMKYEWLQWWAYKGWPYLVKYVEMVICGYGNELIRFTQKDGPAEVYVHAMHPNIGGGRIGLISQDEIIWFGTDSKGVTFYDGFAWSSLDTQDGLAGNTVTAIAQDADGSFWFGTSDGGLTRYRRSTSRPSAYITSVTTDKTYRDLSAIPDLTTGTRATIEYSAIDFKTVPDKRQYQVRVQAFGKSLSKKELDLDWCKPTKSTSFDYIFPESGTYTFQVQAIGGCHRGYPAGRIQLRWYCPTV